MGIALLVPVLSGSDCLGRRNALQRAFSYAVHGEDKLGSFYR